MLYNAWLYSRYNLFVIRFDPDLVLDGLSADMTYMTEISGENELDVVPFVAEVRIKNILKYFIL